ncbi:MAG: hypothetical protein D6688_11735 [Alphaproteobacteria bacterium]|nr:MAG: hypothetical protein D6688_11735 [Alphaproteobacteria bacterium]
MGLAKEHELHRRRAGRNIGVGLLLGGFVLLVFAVTVVKLVEGQDIRPHPTIPLETTPKGAGQ